MTGGATAAVTEQDPIKDFSDKEVFMEMLLAQLQNQDPLSPMESQDFTAQLAQLSTVEQLRDVNSNLETLQLYESSINNAQSVSMIGKNVKAKGDQIQLEDGKAKLSYHLDGDPATTKITIFGPDGDLVRTAELSKQDAGLNTYSWNGLDNNGSPCAAGNYSFNVTAAEEDGTLVSATTLIQGEVVGVSFDSGVPKLSVDGQKVTIGDIYEVSQ